MSESHIYKAQVLADYDAKKAANQLRQVMNEPTTADLRNEWLRLCEKNFDVPCKNVLDLFFKEQEDFADYKKVIRKEGADKCRPLWGFLRDRTIATAERNIELLAFLIDFQPKPYTTWLRDPERHNRILLTENNADGSNAPNGNGTETGVTRLEPNKPGWQKSPRIMIAMIVIVLLCSGGIYIMGHGEGNLSGEKADSLQTAARKEKPADCMVWKQDHYEYAPCDRPSDSDLIVPLDTQRLMHLKKVVNTDKIKMADAGKLWYFKPSGHLECFTAGGPYPPDTNRRLLPLTQYMIRKYIHPEEPDGIMSR